MAAYRAFSSIMYPILHLRNVTRGGGMAPTGRNVTLPRPASAEHSEACRRCRPRRFAIAQGDAESAKGDAGGLRCPSEETAPRAAHAIPWGEPRIRPWPRARVDLRSRHRDMRAPRRAWAGAPLDAGKARVRRAVALNGGQRDGCRCWSRSSGLKADLSAGGPRTGRWPRRWQHSGW